MSSRITSNTSLKYFRSSSSSFLARPALLSSNLRSCLAWKHRVLSVGLLKYGAGLPFHRIEKPQQGFGIPMPGAPQWELVNGGAQQLEPAHEELIRQGAQGEVLYNDDTTMKIL